MPPASPRLVYFHSMGREEVDQAERGKIAMPGRAVVFLSALLFSAAVLLCWSYSRCSRGHLRRRADVAWAVQRGASRAAPHGILF